MAKWLLWEDPAYAHMSPQVPGSKEELRTAYAGLCDRLTAATRAARDGGDGQGGQEGGWYPLNHHLAFPKALARVLAAKLGLRDRLRAAYLDGALAELARLADEELAEADAAVAELWQIHRACFPASSPWNPCL